MKEKNYYVDPKELLDELVSYRNQVKENERAGLEKPPISPRLAEMLFSIANHLTFRWNFNRYPYRDEMVMDACESLVKYCDRFDPDVSTNAFSYLTTICYWSFVARIKTEKQQDRVKAKLVQSIPIDVLIDKMESGDATDMVSEYVKKTVDYYLHYDHEDKKETAEKPTQAVETPLSKLLED